MNFSSKLSSDSALPKFYLFLSLLVLNCTGLNAQNIFGLNLEDPNDTTGFFFNNSLDAAGSDFYLKNDPGLFDRILLNRGLGFICTVNHPNANRFVEIYSEIKKVFGFEDDNKDIVPEGIVEDDIIAFCLKISDGKARIVRFWYEQKFNIKLDYSNKNMEVFISFF